MKSRGETRIRKLWYQRIVLAFCFLQYYKIALRILTEYLNDDINGLKLEAAAIVAILATNKDILNLDSTRDASQSKCRVEEFARCYITTRKIRSPWINPMRFEREFEMMLCETSVLYEKYSSLGLRIEKPPPSEDYNWRG